MASASEEDITKVKTHLRNNNIKLWLPPYSDEQGRPQHESITNIVSEISEKTLLPQDLVSNCVTNLHQHSVQRLRKMQQNIVSLRIKCSQTQGSNTESIEVSLAISGAQLKTIIAEKLGIEDDLKLICGGRIIENDASLQSQRIRNNNIILCLVVKASDRNQSKEVEKALNEVKRARQGAELLAKAGVDDDGSAGGYDIEIEDQNGQALEIPAEEKRSLTIALGLHEKGRAILKRKEYELALLLLLEADKEFETCRSEILSMVDNYAVLCLDIVWCYVCSKNIAALPDAKLRLDSCEKAFKKSYGDSLQRLLAIKGSSGSEITMFVRLYVLQAILHYHDENYQECSLLLDKAQGFAKMVAVDQDKVSDLMGLGLSAREARRALRQNNMNVTLASQWAFKQREENQETKKRERERRRKRKMQKEFGSCANGDPVNIESYHHLVDTMGFDPGLAVEALKHANNAMSDAIEMISNDPDTLRLSREENQSRNKPKQTAAARLKAMGFDEATAKACLHHFSGAMEEAAEYLANATGEIPAEWVEAYRGNLDQEGSSKYTEDELVMMREVAQDVTQKHDEYLDVMLYEEMGLIQQYRAMLLSIAQH